MHDAINDRLSEYLDDELSPDERATVDEHLRTCARCQADLDDLRAVVVRATRLQDAPPDADLWPGVAVRIAASRQVRPFAPARRFSFTLPQLIAASLALMVLSGGMVWLARLGGSRTDFPAVAAVEDLQPVNFADSAYDDAIADLQRTLEGGRDRLDEETVRVFEDNLKAIDHAIAQCREALQRDTANIYLRDYLSATRAKKLHLLRHAAGLVDRAN